MYKQFTDSNPSFFSNIQVRSYILILLYRNVLGWHSLQIHYHKLGIETLGSKATICLDIEILSDSCELVRKIKLLIISRIMITRKELKSVKFRSRLLPKQSYDALIGNLFLSYLCDLIK